MTPLKPQVPFIESVALVRGQASARVPSLLESASRIFEWKRSPGFSHIENRL